ncbi:MAG: hypothetical protein ACRC3J_05110 [Culicoidibacterales bacterium]
MNLLVNKVVTTDFDAPKFNLSGGKDQAMFIAYKNKPAGIALVPADSATRKEFGTGVFRIAKGETNGMDGYVVKVDLAKGNLYFVDNNAYTEGNLKWQKAVKLQRVILRNREDILKAYNITDITFP